MIDKIKLGINWVLESKKIFFCFLLSISKTDFVPDFKQLFAQH